MSRKKFLKEGEVICDKCRGDSIISGPFASSICSKCWGTGKLDWIELCTGKKMPDSLFALPKIRTMYPKLIAEEIISIQPMQGIKYPKEIKL